MDLREARVVTRRARVTLGRTGPVVAVALVAVALGALRALDPEARGAAGWLRETGGALALGVAFLGAGRGAFLSSALLARARRRQPDPALLARAMLRSGRAVIVDAALALALALPVLAAGWEFGAPAAAVVSTAAVVLGCALAAWVAGLVCGATGLAPTAAAFAGAALLSIVAWPVTLGWSGTGERAFPFPELPAWAVSAALLAGLSLATLLLARRRTWVR